MYLFDLPRQHAALDTQHCRDVHVLPAHLIHPLGETVDCRLEQHPGELDDVKHSFDDVVWGKEKILPRDIFFMPMIHLEKNSSY